MTTIKIDGIDRVLSKLNSIEAVQQWGYRPMTQSAALVQDTIANYKTKAKGAFSELATAKQKRAYWARVRSGAISHGPNGYIRTNNLGRRWTFTVKTDGEGIKGEVGNNVNYAPFVHSAKAQQPFHKKTGFTTDEQAIDENRSKINTIWRREVRRLLNA